MDLLVNVSEKLVVSSKLNNWSGTLKNDGHLSVSSLTAAIDRWTSIQFLTTVGVFLYSRRV